MNTRFRFVAIALASALLFAAQASTVQASTASACTSCRAKATDNLITFSPLFEQNKPLLSSFVLLGADGLSLDSSLYETLPPSSPDAGVLVSPTSFRVHQGVSFRLLLDGRLLTVPQPLDITIVGSGSTHSIDLQALNQQVVSDFSFDAPTQVLSLSARGTKNILIQETHEALGLSYAFIGLQLRGSVSGGIFMQVFEPTRALVFRENHGNASTWDITLTRTTVKGSGTYRATNIPVPRGGYLKVSYSNWGGTKGRPTLTVVSARPNSTSTPIPLRLV